jgi:integrase
MQNRKRNGQIVRIGKYWYVRYWDHRSIGRTLQRKRFSHQLGAVTTRGKRPPADIVSEAERHMGTVNGGVIPAERILTISDFVERVYLKSVEQHKRPSTFKSYRDIWQDHLKPLCGATWLRDTRTYHVQGWLDKVGAGKLSRNTLKHIKSVISGIFAHAKQQDYFYGENPAHDTKINPKAAEPVDTYAYTLEEIFAILGLLPEPATTAFAVAAFMGLRHGEIQGLLWQNYRDGELYVSRSIWNGRETAPKTSKSQAHVPVIPLLAKRLEMHRLRCGNPSAGPIFANAKGKPLALSSVVNRLILPTLNCCEVCARAEVNHQKADHPFKRDGRLPVWHGWHAARRGLGSNLYRLGVPDKVIQRILRHANVSTTANYYIKTADDDVRDAMAKLENAAQDTYRTLKGNFAVQTPTLQ